MSYRYEKVLPVVGEVRRATGLYSPAEIEEFNGLMRALVLTRPEVARLFQRGELTASDLIAASRTGGLDMLAADARTLLPLWGEQGAIERALGGARAHPDTLRRYRVSFQKLARLQPLPLVDGGHGHLLRVADLARVDWDRVEEEWVGSASDWMAFYRAMSACLTRLLGGKRTGKAHPFRLQVMDALPRRRVSARIPELSPDLFRRIILHIPERVRVAYPALVVTGFRRGEYLALRPDMLLPDLCAVRVPGTKTEASATLLRLAPEAYALVECAVPSPVRAGWLRRWWARACLAEGVASLRENPVLGKPSYHGPRLHDLRHCAGQWAVSAGLAEAEVQHYLRHSDPNVTRGYTLQNASVSVSRAIMSRLRV